MAGLNAALKVSGGQPFTLTRADAYIGVMIDDLITRGTTEPYRMFTSRAEYRLTLRADNADQRLTPKGLEIGCVATERRAVYAAKQASLTHAKNLCNGLKASPNKLWQHGLKINADGIVRSALDLLAYADIQMSQLAAIWPELQGLDPAIVEQLEIDGKYAGYIERQDVDIRAFRKDEDLQLPADLDVTAIGSLSAEICQKLRQVKPATIGAAARIPGMTPAAVIALLRYVKRNEDSRETVNV